MLNPDIIIIIMVNIYSVLKFKMYYIYGFSFKPHTNPWRQALWLSLNPF